MAFDKNKFFSFKKPYQIITTPDGQVLHLRTLQANERVEIGTLARAQNAAENIDGQLSVALKLIEVTVCEEDGTSIFTAEDAAALQKLDAQTFDFIAEAAMKASGLGKPAAEEAVKNLPASQTSSLPSDSPQS